MVEWSITTVLKTVVPRGTGGSNPSLSANYERTFEEQPLTFNKLAVFSCHLKATDAIGFISRDQFLVIQCGCPDINNT